MFAFKDGNFCRPSSCPTCKQRVFFIRHNGGSLWVEELGWPWPKHEHFAGSNSEDLYAQIKGLPHQAPREGELNLSGECLVGLIRKVILHAGGTTYLVDALDPHSRAKDYQPKLAALQVWDIEHKQICGLITLHWEKGSMVIADEKGQTLPVTNAKITERKLQEFMASKGKIIRAR